MEAAGVSAWDDTGYALDDPKHPVNAGAGVGMGGRAKRADQKPFVCRDPLGEWVADQESAANDAARKAEQ